MDCFLSYLSRLYFGTVLMKAIPKYKLTTTMMRLLVADVLEVLL